MAKLLNYNHMFFIVVIFIVFGLQACAVPYDHRYTSKCMARPLKPQYGGGIVVNPELNDGLNGWRMNGDARMDHVASEDGNLFIVAYNRQLASHSFAQTILLEEGKIYAVSAWLQVSRGKAHVAAVFETETGHATTGWVMAREGCWSMLKGGFTAKKTGLAHLYFATNVTEVDIFGDSFSVQSFTLQEWQSHRQHRIQKVRKTRVMIQAVDQAGQAIPNATVSLTQTRPRFLTGCAINANILGNQAYQRWFLSSKFQVTVFENEMKWYSTGYAPNVEDYRIPDEMMQFAQSNGIQVRGHNVLWNKDLAQPGWVQPLWREYLWNATYNRMYSVMNRYKGQLNGWDLDNELLHWNFFETHLGDPAVSTKFHQIAHKIDPKATLFLNEFNTLECAGDPAASPPMLLEKINQMRSQGFIGSLAFGLQSHFRQESIDLGYIRSSLDVLGNTGLDIWATELDVTPGPNQVNGLEQVLQELYAHPAVKAAIFWSGWSDRGCYVMCLTDNNFNNLPTGQIVDSFLYQLRQAGDDFDAPKTTDSNGFFETTLTHGDYDVTVSHPSQQYSSFRTIKVGPKKSKPQFHLFTVINP